MGVEDLREKDLEEKQEEQKELPKRKASRSAPKAKLTQKKLQVKEENVNAAPDNRQEAAPSKIPATQQEKWSEAEGELAVDVYQTDEDIVIQSTIAGVKPEDLDITVERDTVTIRGERGNGVTERAKNYFHQECYWGAFSRQVILPEEINPAAAEASMKNNILTLRLPKTERQKVKRIKVRE